MKIILLQDLRGLGRKHDIKEVSDGYAQNFLLPQKVAVSATKENLNKRDLRVKEHNHHLDQLKKMAFDLEKEELKFKVKTGEKGEMFKSVSQTDILKFLNEKGYQAEEIKIKKPLKEIGEHEVVAVFGEGIEAKIKVRLQSL